MDADKIPLTPDLLALHNKLAACPAPSPVAGTEPAAFKPLKLTDVWEDEAGLTAFIYQQAQLEPDTKKKRDKIQLAIKQAMDQRSRLQGKHVQGYGFSNRRR